MLEIIKNIILGIIQGLTEPLPISSSGHLLIFQNLFDSSIFESSTSTLAFAIIANFASFLAILLIFRKDVIKLIQSFFKFLFSKDEKVKKETKVDFKYVLMIVVSTIPVCITGLLFADLIENKLSTLTVIGIALLITSLALFVVKNIKGSKENKDITYFDAVLIGLFQGIAIIPGISRSGTVLVACLLRDFKRETALKYTFILYFPVSIASMVFGISDLLKLDNLNELLLPFSLGFIASFIVTYFSYKWLSDIVKKGKLWWFSIYCIIVGLFVIFML